MNMTGTPEKQCICCARHLALSEYDKSRYTDGPAALCRQCVPHGSSQDSCPIRGSDTRNYVRYREK
jgi:hypothetical protein